MKSDIDKKYSDMNSLVCNIHEVLLHKCQNDGSDISYINVLKRFWGDEYYHFDEDYLKNHVESINELLDSTQNFNQYPNHRMPIQLKFALLNIRTITSKYPEVFKGIHSFVFKESDLCVK